MDCQIGYFVGSLSSTSINRILSRALIRLARTSLSSTEISIGSLALYSPDYDHDYPAEATELKAAITRSDAVLFVTPEYNRSIPGALKNAIDWATRPWDQNSFHHIPAAVIGASIGAIGTAVGQQSLRAVLRFCNARQMTSPEAYIHFTPEVFVEDGEAGPRQDRSWGLSWGCPATSGNLATSGKCWSGLSARPLTPCTGPTTAAEHPTEEYQWRTPLL